MKNFLIAFLVFLVWSVFGLWLYSWLQPVRTTNETEVASSITNTTPPLIDEPLNIDDSAEFNLEDKDTLKFTEHVDDPSKDAALPSGLKAVTPNGDLVFLYEHGISFIKNSSTVEISEEVKDFKYKLNTYLIEHPNEELHIKSLYSASEEIENPNFGFKRGKSIEDILVKTGIPKEKIVVTPAIRAIDFDHENVGENCISFSLHPLDTERIESLKLALPEVKTVYPKFKDNNIYDSKELRDLGVEINNVIADNPEVKIQIIGHTDNVGNANDNYRQALRKARQVRWYLVEKAGIKRDRLVAISQGESQSIASNKTKRGRFLNRRIEILFLAD